MTVNVSTYVLRDSAGAIIPFQLYDPEAGICTPIGSLTPMPVLSGSVIADNGVALPIDSLAQTLTYSAGLVSTSTVIYGGLTYVQTYTATAGYITGISQWVKQ